MSISTLVLWDLENIKNHKQGKQIDLFLQKRQIDRGRGSNVTHVVFMGKYDTKRNKAFKQWLICNGFLIQEKEPKKSTNKDGAAYYEVDMDGEIVKTLLSESKGFTTVVLVSGDGDMYLPLMEVSKHSFVEVISLRGRMSKKLKNFKNEYISCFKVDSNE